MPKTTTKKLTTIGKHAANGKPAKRTKRASARKPQHKPLDQMTLEELTLFGFQLAYEQHQQQLSKQADEQVHA